MNKISEIRQLEAIYGDKVPAAIRKQTDHLTPLQQQWIKAARFCILSTVGEHGVHGTPRGDDGPVISVVHNRRLLMPDWRGNNRIEALRDIVSDGRVALLFMVPGVGWTIRVNGQAFVTDDPELCASFAKTRNQSSTLTKSLPNTVIVIDIKEVYTQCAKAILRSGLWGRDDSADVPKIGAILQELSNGIDGGGDYDATYAEKAKPRMW